jgi:hypothetical protein
MKFHWLSLNEWGKMKNCDKKRINYLGDMILDRQNLPAIAKEMDILYRFL